MPKFFSNYPKINYDLFSDGSSFELTNISRAVILNSNRIQDDSALYTYYDIVDGERPDVVSHKLYGTPDYYWTFFITNDTLRDGYLASWPLSYQNFTLMIDREYGPYSALSLAPIVDPVNDLNGTAHIDISCIPLDEKYLSYLKFVSYDGEYRSSILRYDTTRHQIIIYNIHRIVGGIRVDGVARESFVENTNIAYRIVWDDNVREIGMKDIDAQKKNTILKEEWIDLIYNNIKRYDIIGIEEQLAAETPIVEYVQNKSILVASPDYCWSEYRNAAHQYVLPTGEAVSAYDVLTNPNIVFSTYKTFYEHESDINDAKRTIRVIRADAVVDFASLYFDTLNDNL